MQNHLPPPLSEVTSQDLFVNQVDLSTLWRYTNQIIIIIIIIKSIQYCANRQPTCRYMIW